MSDVHGRDDEIDRLVRSAAPITVLTGDSGVGKSTVLQAAQAATTVAIAPSPRRVAAAGGVLQHTLLSALADALAADIEERGGLHEVGRLLATTAESVVKNKGQELARVVGKELLALARARLGPEVGDALVEYGKSLKEAADTRLAMRLEAALDRTAVETVLDFANAIAEQSERGAVVLALDAGERLAGPDLGLLADLAESLPGAVRLRIAIADDSDERRSAVDRLLTLNPAIAEISLAGISLDAVRGWLEHEGLDASLAERVLRVTAGYGLHVGDLIPHLRDGGEPDDAPLHQQLARRTDEAWHGLSTGVAAIARRLCVLADPLGQDATLALLGIDASTWGEVSARLEHARIFSVHVDGQPWFHDERRRYLLDAKLSDSEHAEASAQAVPHVRRLVVEEELVERAPELAELVAGAPSLLAADEQLADAVGLDVDQVAVAAALIELIEPAMELPAVGGDELLRHARETFRSPGDLVRAVRALGRTSFVAVTEAPDAAAVVPYWRDDLVMLTICGRAARLFGRLPVPAAAGAVWDTELRPRLGTFVAGGYGIGNPSFAQLAGESNTLVQSQSNGFGKAGTGRCLLVRGDYADRGLYLHAYFDSSEQCEAAAQQLAGMHSEVFRQPFAVVDILRHPLPALPAGRFISALKLVYGPTLAVRYREVKGTRSLGAAIPLEARLERHVSLVRTLRERMSREEQLACGLDATAGYIYAEGTGRGNRHWDEIVEVLNGVPGVRRSGIEPIGFAADPFGRYLLEQRLELPPGSRVGRITHQGSAGPRLEDPAVELVNQIGKRLVEFNREQLPDRVSLADEQELRDRIQQALDTRRHDAEALLASGALDAPEALPGPRRHLLEVRVDDEGYPPASWGAFTSSVTIDGDRDEVEVAFRPASWSPRISQRRDDGWTHGDATVLVADALGHRADDVRLVVADA